MRTKKLLQNLLDSSEGLGRRVQDMERRLETGEVKAAGVSSTVAGQDFSFCRAIMGIATNQWKGAERERDAMLAAGEKRALSQGTTTAGGFLVPEQHSAEMTQLLRNASFLAQLPTRRMEGLTGSPVNVSQQDGAAVSRWVAENSAITDDDQTFTETALVPHQLASLTKLSARLLRMGIPGAEQIVREDLMKVTAIELDRTALEGSGVGEEPVGIVSTAGINETVLSGAVTFDALTNLVADLDIDNVADTGGRAWVMNPVLRRELGQLVDGNSRPLLDSLNTWAGDSVPMQRLLLGYPWHMSNTVTKVCGPSQDRTRLFLVDWNDFIWASWGTMELAASNVAGAAFENNQMFIRILSEHDYALKHAVSAAVLDDITF